MVKQAATCRVCGSTFHTARSHAKTCSAACRKRASRESRNELAENTRAAIIGRALQRSAYLLGPVANATRGLTVPRSAALAELNAFLRMPEPVTDDELKAALRANGWRDHGSGN
jgi:hypothetical protein